MKHRNVIIALAASLLLARPAFTQEQSAPPAKEKAAPALTITQARLGTGVENRKLLGETGQFELNQKVYLWLEVTGGPAADITVTWKHGDHVWTTTLKTGGPTYHTWAYKTAALGGAWTVSVADAAGNELKNLQFTVGPPPAK